MAKFPQTAPRAKPTARRFVAFVLARDGLLLARQRPAGVVNSHLWEFPNVEVAIDDTHVHRAAHQALGLSGLSLAPLCTIKHTITRYRIKLEAYRVAATQLSATPPPGSRWLTLSQLNRLPFTSAHKKILGVLRQ